MLIQEMSAPECYEVLKQSRLGRLACCQENQPYIVPIYFIYQNSSFYGFTTPGQKVEWMRSNPSVCVEVDQVEGPDQWMSIVAFGRYEELRDNGEGANEWRRACALLQSYAVWWEPGSASSQHRDASHPAMPLYYRIDIHRITGRRAVPEPA